jgi:DNA polymerase-1
MSLFAKEPPILAVDVANLAHRAYHANKHLSIGSGERAKPTGHVYGMVKMLLPLVKRFSRGDKLPTLWWALEGRATRRREIYPEYKAGRKRNFDPYPDVRKLVLRMPGQAFFHPRLEADDLLAVMAHPDTRKDREVIVVTTDRDLWQFVGRPGVKVWCKDHVVQSAEMVATFGVYHCRSLALVKALFGDTTDNIPPAFPGMKHGPLLSLINEKTLASPETLWEHLEGTPLPPKIRDRMQAEWPTLERNWKLVKLRSKHAYELHEGPSTPDKLINYLEGFQCRSLYDAVKVLWR